MAQGPPTPKQTPEAATWQQHAAATRIADSKQSPSRRRVVASAVPGLKGAAAFTKRHSRGCIAHYHALRAGNDVRATGHAIGVATPFALAAALPQPMRPGTRLRTAGRPSWGPRACLPPAPAAARGDLRRARADGGKAVSPGGPAGCWRGLDGRPQAESAKAKGKVESPPGLFGQGLAWHL